MTLHTQDIEDYFDEATRVSKGQSALRQAQQARDTISEQVKALYNRLPPSWREHPLNIVEHAYRQRKAEADAYQQDLDDWQHAESALRAEMTALRLRFDALRQLEALIEKIHTTKAQLQQLMDALQDREEVIGTRNAISPADFLPKLQALSTLQPVADHLLDKNFESQAIWVNHLQNTYGITLRPNMTLDDILAQLQEDVDRLAGG